MSVDSVQSSTTSTTTTSSTRNTGELGKDDFLNLLVTQLKYQDPLSPMENQEFIAQMAQFSALEQMQNMNTTISNSAAFALVGKEITAIVANEETGAYEEITGTVDSVKLSNGEAYAVVDETDVAVDDIQYVHDTTTTAQETVSITDYTNMIGKNVTAVFIDAETYESMDISGDVSEITMINGTAYSMIDGAEFTINDVELSDDEEEFEDLEAYLSEHVGEEITVVVTNTVVEDGEVNEYDIRITGVLKEYEAGEETSVVLDEVGIPANNVVSIR